MPGSHLSTPCQHSNSCFRGHPCPSSDERFWISEVACASGGVDALANTVYGLRLHAFTKRKRPTAGLAFALACLCWSWIRFGFGLLNPTWHVRQRTTSDYSPQMSQGLCVLSIPCRLLAPRLSRWQYALLQSSIPHTPCVCMGEIKTQQR